MTHSLNIIFDGFGIRLLGYRIECSCLYFHKGIILLVLCGYKVLMHIIFLYFEHKIPNFNNQDQFRKKYQLLNKKSRPVGIKKNLNFLAQVFCLVTDSLNKKDVIINIECNILRFCKKPFLYCTIYSL